MQVTPASNPIKKERVEVQRRSNSLVQRRLGRSLVNSNNQPQKSREAPPVHTDAPIPGRIRHRGESKDVVKAAKDRSEKVRTRIMNHFRDHSHVMSIIILDFKLALSI